MLHVLAIFLHRLSTHYRLIVRTPFDLMLSDKERSTSKPVSHQHHNPTSSPTTSLVFIDFSPLPHERLNLFPYYLPNQHNTRTESLTHLRKTIFTQFAKQLHLSPPEPSRTSTTRSLNRYPTNQTPKTENPPQHHEPPLLPQQSHS